MARAKPFMEQLQGAIKKFLVKCCSAWVGPNNTAAFGPLSSSDWLTFIAEWIPFHSEEGRRQGVRAGAGETDGEDFVGGRYDEAGGEFGCHLAWWQDFNSKQEENI